MDASNVSDQLKVDDSTSTGTFGFLKDLAAVSGIAFAYAFGSGYFYLTGTMDTSTLTSGF